MRVDDVHDDLAFHIMEEQEIRVHGPRHSRLLVGHRQSRCTSGWVAVPEPHWV